MYTNINSLRYKIPALEWEINQSSSIDIIALTETKLGLEINTGELNIRGFQLFRKDRNDQGGGIAVYLRNELQVTVINIQSLSEALLLKIKTGKGTFFSTHCLPSPKQCKSANDSNTL